MIAFVERRSGERWLVVLNDHGDLIHNRRVECAPKAQGLLAPIVSKEQYDADRQTPSKPADAKIGAQFENTGGVVKLRWPKPSTRPQLAAKPRKPVPVEVIAEAARSAVWERCEWLAPD